MEASCCLENDADVIMMLLLYLEVERRKESGRGSRQLLQLSEIPEIQTCPRSQVMWDFLESITPFQETVPQMYSCFHSYHYKAYYDELMLNCP